MSVSVWEQVIHRENEELRHLEGDGAESSANRSVVYNFCHLNWIVLRILKKDGHPKVKVLITAFLATDLKKDMDKFTENSFKSIHE